MYLCVWYIHITYLYIYIYLIYIYLYIYIFWYIFFVFFITAFEIIVFTTDSWNKFPGLFVPRPPIDLENSNLHVLAFWRTVFFSIHHDANCCWPERFELMFSLGSLCSLAWWSSYYNIVNTMISGSWKLQDLGTIIISWYWMILYFDFGWMICMIRFQILVKASTTKLANCSSLSHSRDLRKTVAPKKHMSFLDNAPICSILQP